MSKVIFILLIIMGYIIPCYIVYKYSQKFYSKEGRWDNQSVMWFDIFLTFFPLINLIYICILSFEQWEKWSENNNNKGRILNRLYKVKK